MCCMQNVQRSISFDQKLWSDIDKKRGDVSRSRFIAIILAEMFDTFKEKYDSSEKGLQTKGEETK